MNSLSFIVALLHGIIINDTPILKNEHVAIKQVISPSYLLRGEASHFENQYWMEFGRQFSAITSPAR